MVYNIQKGKAPYNDGSTCPYCDEPTKLVVSTEIYGRDYGKLYVCLPCEAHVGTHEGTEIALGRVANYTDRRLKKIAHMYFDRLWKEGYIDKILGEKPKHARNASYKWLSEKLDMPVEECHIGMMDGNQCDEVINITRRALIEVGWKFKPKGYSL